MGFSRKFSKRHCFKCTLIYFLTCCMFFNTSLSVVLAGPEGAQVINGQVSFQQSGYNTTITASDKSIINYSSFDIARPEIVQFIQPGSSASVLNRILSANPTNINGTLLANGRVFFVNPAGVYIGAGARVNVNQLVASGLNITNSDFINGQYNFAGGNGSVVNSGDISAKEVYLIGKQVTNSGTISCPDGYVVMASGDRVFLGEPGTDVVLEMDALSVPESAGPVEGSGVLNEGTVDAAGGTIVLAAGDIYSQAISNTGSLSASVETGDAGQITLSADGGQITNTGIIETSGDNGGSITIAGGDVLLAQEGVIQADSISDGAGGSVAVFADALVANGLITANGIEGKYGNILLDPTSVTVDSILAGHIVTAMSGAGYQIVASDTIIVDAKIDSSAQSSSTTLSFEDEDTNNDLTINLNNEILLGANQTLTGDGTQINVASTGLIQNGIDVAAAGNTVDVAAGSFTENLSIGKSVTLEGAQVAVAVSGRIAGDASESTLTGVHTITGSTVTIDGFTLSDPDAGSGNVLVGLDSSGGAIDSITVKNNFVELGSGDIGIDFGGASTTNQTITNVTIEDSVFNGPGDKASNPMRIGSWFGADYDVEVDNITFRRNVVDRGSIPIQLEGESLANITISENTFTNTDGTVYVWSNANPSNPVRLSNFDYSNNDVDSSNTYGVGIGVGNNLDDDDLDAGTITITNNSFDNVPGGYGIGAVSVVSSGFTGTIDATENWWGDASGPADSSDDTATGGFYNPTGLGSGVSDHVDYSPWYGVGTNTSGNTGFQPVSPMTWGMLPSSSSSDFDEWVGLAATGDTLKLDYSGDASIPAIDDTGKDLNLDIVSGGTLTVGGKIDVGGDVDLGAAGDVIVNSAIDPANVILNAVGDVDINAAVTGTTLVDIDAGTDVTIAALVTGGAIDIDAGSDVLFDGVAGALTADDVITVDAGGSIANTASTVATTIETTTVGDNVILTSTDTITASTQAFVVDSSGLFTLAGPMSGTDVTVDSVDKLTIDGKLTATGAVVLQSSSDDVEINAEIDPTTVTLDAADDVTINANITGTTSISAHAGTDGTGDVTFGAGVTLDAPIVTLQAGDGLGGNDTTAQVDIMTNTPTVAANSSLTVKQDGQMGNDVTPWNPDVTNNATIDLNLQSDDSSIYTTEADSWKSITATAKDNIELQGNGNININSAGLSSTSGGVRIVSTGGIISTPGAGGMLDAPITGYSDHSADIGVNWIVGNGKAAIIIQSYFDELKLGANAILTANGSYDPSADDRGSFLFNLGGAQAGEPIDVAIYLGALLSNVEMGSGSVSIDNTDGIGTLMIDAYDTILFTSAFEDSLTDPRADNVEWLEVVSRSSPDLETVIGINPPLTLKLPHADNLDDIAGGLYDGEYVLRGNLWWSTEVLGVREAVPLVLPKPLEPEMQGEVEVPDMAAIAQLLDELGIGVQPFLARAYRPSLNTDLSLIKAAEKLLRLGPTLEDADGTRIAALIPLIRGISETPVPVEEQMTSFVQELANQELAGQWINALTEYAAILNNEIGLPADDSVARIMVRYGGKLTGPAENLFVEEYLAQTFAE